MKRHFVVRFVWVSGFLGALLVGLALLAATFSPFESVKPLVDGLAGDGEIESFTPDLFGRIRTGLGIIGFGLLLLSGLLLLARARFQNAVASIPRRFSHTISLLGDNLRTIWQDLGGIKSDGVFLYGLAALTVLAAAVRMLYLSQPMRYDEAYTFLVFASRPLDFITSNYHVANNHVFHTLLVALASRGLGDQPWIIRLPAFLSGMLMTPASYLLARMLYGRSVALLTASLVASSSFLIEYSTNARGYTMLSLFTLLVLALGVYLKAHPRNYAGWIGLAILSALGFYTLPVMLYPFGALVVWLFFSALAKDVGASGRGALLKPLVFTGLLAVALTLLLYEPILREWGFEALAGKGSFNFKDFGVWWVELEGSLISTWRSWTRDLPIIIAWILAGGFLASLVLHRRLSHTVIPMSIVMILWCGGLVFLQGVAPWPRVWLFLMPLFFMWSSAGLIGAFTKLAPETFREKAYLPIMGALLLAVLLGWNVYRQGSVLESGQTGTLKAAEEIALYLEERLQKGDVVAAAVPSNYPLRYYFQYHQIPDEYLYRPRYGPEFERAWIVVNLKHGQSLAGVIEAERMNEFVDPTRVEMGAQFDGAIVYRYLRQ